MSIDPGHRVSVISTRVSGTSYENIAAWADSHIRAKRASRQPVPARTVFVCTVHSVMSGYYDPDFAALLNRGDIATPDGMPLVWALRSFGVKGQTRVYGPDLTLALCAQAAVLGHRIYLYGGRPDSLELLQQKLCAKFPRLQVVGAFAPPFRPLTPDEDAAIVAAIRTADPDLIFVGIGMPKQERWIDSHRDLLPGTILLGVGAAFDFHAGRVRQAPRWMMRCGLEWFFRLLMEPRRLWRRYLLNFPFLALWALQWVRWRFSGQGSGSTGQRRSGGTVC